MGAIKKIHNFLQTSQKIHRPIPGVERGRVGLLGRRWPPSVTKEIDFFNSLAQCCMQSRLHGSNEKNYEYVKLTMIVRILR